MQPCRFVFSSLEEAAEEEIASSQIIIGRFPAGKVKTATSLEWLQLPMAGTDAYVVPGVVPDNVILTNSAGAYGLAVSEYMLAAYFKLLDRRAVDSLLAMPERGTFFRAMSSWIGFRKTNKEKPEYVDEQYTLDKLPEMIGRADIVSMILPATEETKNLMDARLLRRMKKGSYLINAGRGNAVDLKALREALDEGRIAGAALDVTSPEPLPADDPLWKYENVLITPHVAGNLWLRQTVQNVIRIAGNNLNRYLNGEPLDHVVKR